MDKSLRHHFDQILEEVLDTLPIEAREALGEIPLYVEDRPSQRVMRLMNIADPLGLLGWFGGYVRGNESLEAQPTPRLSPAIHVYREGILSTAQDDNGNIDDEELRRQIRITVLHELGHYHGLDEDDLEEKGYG